jgi:hypothetical protein
MKGDIVEKLIYFARSCGCEYTLLGLYVSVLEINSQKYIGRF